MKLFIPVKQLTDYFQDNRLVTMVLIAALVLRVFLSPLGTLELDFNTFVAWSVRLNQVGFGQFYNAWSDYFPGYLYILWFLGKINTLAIVPSTLLYKLPAILADVGTGWLIYIIIKQLKSEKWALIATSAYVFNPAVFANSALWGQADSLTVFFSLLAVYLYKKKYLASAVFLALGILIKPQALFAGIIIFLLAARQKWIPKKMLVYGLVVAVLFVAAFVPFASGRNIFEFIIERLDVSLNQYPYTSVNAFNFWGLFGFWKKETMAGQAIGALVIILTCVIVFLKNKTVIKNPYPLLALVFLTGFLFATRMHERHLLPVFAPLSIAASTGNPLLWLVYAGLSVIYLANLRFAYVWITDDFATIFTEGQISALIITGLILWFLLLYILYTGKGKFKVAKIVLSQAFVKQFISSKPKPFKFPKLAISKELSRQLLLVILAFSLITRLFGLNYPQAEYFDEVYHAFTARVMLAGDPKAWEWWNPHPEGFAYEWTHPPLAKEGMWLGMLIFGENSLGWRLPGALLGTASVLMVYLIAKRVFKDDLVGLLSAAVFSLDGLPLVMSRIAMNDSYLLFFVLLSAFLYLRDNNFWSALAFGLALASKWSALWAVPIFVAAHFIFKKRFRLSYLWFIVLPPLVYLASYIPMFVTGHGFDIFVGVQKQMWWYHTRLEATHPYTSPWWSWPLLLKPIWIYTSSEANGRIANIYAMGNPFVFWFGLLSVIYALYLSVIHKSKKLAWVVFCYLVFFVPWAASPRIMFLYHYLPSVPFMAMAAGFALRTLPKRSLLLLLTLFLVSFAYFYPRWSGMEISSALNDSYVWFDSWR